VKPWKWCQVMYCSFTCHCNTLHHQRAADALPQCCETLDKQWKASIDRPINQSINHIC